MTPGDIKALVREAGWTGIYTQWAEPTGEPNWKPAKCSLTVPVTDEQLQRFVELVETRVKAEQRAASAMLIRSQIHAARYHITDQAKRDAVERVLRDLLDDIT